MKKLLKAAIGVTAVAGAAYAVLKVMEKKQAEQADDELFDEDEFDYEDDIEPETEENSEE